ncbi:hypothetical protein AK812_SmicGene15774 [Symbiodinium microadriaticum]|uniref:Uncharacterized protein n=1 Tax=Symbiodinium microadriaticum TaxID=2951 RepID=A0A1Q9E225_SYMMI|nr:hypothetical protein AK812_SmicGene15774 [Symbiodinium microadriaticum]
MLGNGYSFVRAPDQAFPIEVPASPKVSVEYAEAECSHCRLIVSNLPVAAARLCMQPDSWAGHGRMCEPPGLWPGSRLEATHAPKQHEIAKHAGLDWQGAAKQGDLELLSDHLAAALSEHAAALQSQLQDLLSQQEELSREAASSVERLCRNACGQSETAGDMSFGLPGAVPDSPDRLRPPELLVLPPPAQDEFKVTVPNRADAASWVLETDELASVTASKMLEAIPKVVQSSLQAHERWHQDCLQCWAARQEGLRKQVLERLEKRLNKRAAGGRVGGKRPEGLRHIDSADSLQTPEELPEEPVPTASPAASLPWQHPDWSTPVEASTPDNSSAIVVREDPGQHDLLRQGSFFEVPPTLDESQRWMPATHAWARRCFLLLEDSNRYIIGRIISAFMTAVIMLSTARSPVHAKEPELQQESPSAESSSSAAPVQDSDASCYDTMRTQLQQKVLGDLQNLFGLSDAYQVLAVAMTMIDRFQEQKVKFASEACARSLASFAFTCSGVVDEDIKRRQYLDHLVSTHVMSVKDMRTKECWWAMLLPSKGA